MAKNRPTHVSRPVYPGGIAAMKKFVAANLKYPPQAIKSKAEGTVTVRYGLDYTGKVINVKIKKGIGHGCDAEAMRVVKLMKFTVPQSSKKKVRIHQDVNIHFKLPKPKPAPKPKAKPKTKTTVTYTQSGSLSGKVVRKKPDHDNTSNSGYSYTIEW
jgi:TonB family protein